jgi:hypothetical protein
MDKTYTVKEKKYFLTGILSTVLLLFLFSQANSAAVLNLFGLAAATDTAFFFSRLLYWLALALVWLYAAKLEKQPLLTWQERRYPLLVYPAMAVILFLLLLIGMQLVYIMMRFTSFTNLSAKLAALTAMLMNNKALLCFTALTAGVTEELIMRGYIQTRLQAVFNNSFIAILVSSLLFGLLHYRYGTLYNVLGPFYIGLVFAVFYWKFRNIKVLIVVHFLWDLLAIYNTGRMQHK